MIKGIDVSKWNGKIDWKKVKNAGIDFAMIRTGYGSKSPNQIDEKFKYNIEGAKENGIDVGVYHYSYANSSSNAREEAEFCLEIIKDYKLEYPVCYDIEDKSIAVYNRQTKTDMCISFCDTIEMAGYYASVYCNLDWIKNQLIEHEILTRYDLWLAQWGAEKPSVACGIWQTSETGKVDGIIGNVDTDIAYKDYKAIISKANLNNLNNTDNNTNTEKTYIVKKGDTLWDIAEKYYGDGSKYIKIKQQNNLKSDIIYEGQTLKL